MYKLFCRAFQKGFWIGSRVLPWSQPTRLSSYDGVISILHKKGCTSLLVVTDKGIVHAGMHKELLDKLRSARVKVTIFDKTIQNPTIDNIEEALSLYEHGKCSAIIALGGGSAIDCAKGVGARVARPKKKIQQMQGLFKVILPMPLFFAIPTTAGSGSETTVAAVITDSRSKEKYAINDTTLIPHYVLFLPELTVGLPPFFTSTTGMDALCHAVEAYIGNSNIKQTKINAIRAIQLIFKSLLDAYENGKNIEARTNMQTAAFLAGAAFTRAYVGNIHAISHALSGQYGTPHGLANAVIMPYVLEIYGESAHKPLWEIAHAVGLADDTTPTNEGAKKFIATIWEMNAKMDIPKKIEGIKKADIPILATRALKEANPLYPVPVIFNQADMMVVMLKVMDGGKNK